MIMIKINTGSGIRLRELRQIRSWTQFELGRRARLHPTLISAAERGRLVLGRGQLKRLARALGVSLAELMSGWTPIVAYL